MATVLLDKEIRIAFENHWTRKHSQGQLMHELRVGNGHAIADLVYAGNSLHCFEIKSDSDNVRRALVQSTVYDKSFPRISLITTSKHLSTAFEILPSYWGIITVDFEDIYKIRYKRPANLSPLFEIEKTLEILWKVELLELLNDFPEIGNSVKLNRSELILSLKKMCNKSTLIKRCARLLSVRNENYQKINWKSYQS